MTQNFRNLSLCATAALIAWSAQSATAAEPTQFKIPAQSMQTALTLFAKQSGIQLLFPYDQVAGLHAQSVNGKMAPDVALQRLIAGSGLKITLSNNNVMALALSARAQKTRAVEVASLGVTALPFAVQSAGAGPAPQAGATSTEEPDGPAIVVTGSRGQARTVTDSPTPIDVISGADLTRTGKAGVFQALNTLVPSFNLPVRAGGATSTVIATGGLRGLNPDQALILVNGKRRHKTSLINAVSTLYNGSVPSDLDMIPTSAVDHIEVLRDGAAAQYGSDAIAGVINIILKDDAKGGSANVTAGQNFDRSDGELYQADLNFGMKLGDSGFANLSLNLKKQEMSNRALPLADCSVTATTTCLYPLIGGQLDPRDAAAVGKERIVTTSFGVMPSRSINTALNAGYDLGGVQLYAFGTYSQRRSDLWYSYRYPKDVNNVMAIYPNGYRPHVMIDEEDFEFTVGAKGELSGWDWDFSTGYGRNRARQSSEGTVNPTLGALSPTGFYIGTLKSSEFVTSLDLTRGFDVGGGNLQVSAGAQQRHERYQTFAGDPASYAVGTFISSGMTPGAQSSAGFQPSDAAYMSRDNYAVYGDVAWDPSKDITIGAAARFEHYDDGSGNTLIWKVNGRYAIAPWIALRAAANTGFRAPAVAQQIYTQTTNQFRTVNGVNNVLLQIKTLAVDDPAAVALGAKPLKPEKSFNISGGVVLTPLPNFNLTIDAYQIDVDDRITITSTLTGTAVSNILIASGIPASQANTLSAQYYTNAIDTRTRGIDIVASYKHNLFDALAMQWNLGYNYNKTKITDIIDNPSELSTISFELFDRARRSNMTTNLPRTKLSISNLATLGDFTLSSRLTRFGKFQVLQNGVTSGGVTTYPNDRSYGAKWITDMELGWQVTPLVNLAVGANNLFNVYPDETGQISATLGQGAYPGTSPIGFTGGFYYARVGLNF
ncbi:TonB-dependent receptor [Sphingobium fuliginis]|uniref:Outer membrane receptor for ferrienterochelin n=1 Tax=Sphingobium fuliginis (strain ATCC 27551) TaxID=336203 RepID=A0A292ZLL9_SPHSA|nr:TonB-dependent receptor [Sphingobium fuliginis]GAY23769.1 outer membrane receptor for ferrienterochelin [Sphingobium fuliginis]